MRKTPYSIAFRFENLPRHPPLLALHASLDLGVDHSGSARLSRPSAIWVEMCSGITSGSKAAVRLRVCGTLSARKFEKNRDGSWKLGKSWGSDHGRHPLARPLRLRPTSRSGKLCELSEFAAARPLLLPGSQRLEHFSFSHDHTLEKLSVCCGCGCTFSGIRAAGTAQEAPRQHGLWTKRALCSAKSLTSAFKARAPRSKSSAGQADEIGAAA